MLRQRQDKVQQVHGGELVSQLCCLDRLSNTAVISISVVCHAYITCPSRIGRGPYSTLSSFWDADSSSVIWKVAMAGRRKHRKTCASFLNLLRGSGKHYFHSHSIDQINSHRNYKFKGGESRLLMGSETAKPTYW